MNPCQNNLQIFYTIVTENNYSSLCFLGFLYKMYEMCFKPTCFVSHHKWNVCLWSVIDRQWPNRRISVSVHASKTIRINENCLMQWFKIYSLLKVSQYLFKHPYCFTCSLLLSFRKITYSLYLKKQVQDKMCEQTGESK